MTARLIARIIVGMTAVALLATGCATNPDGSYEFKRTGLGALGGAVLGAGAGALIGGKSHRGRNAAIGGLTGAVVGGGIGNYMDRQAAALKKEMPQAEVVRDGDKVYVALPSGILFDVGKDTLKPEAKDALGKAVPTLRDSQTTIVIEGHTDSTGSDAVNQPLSERRAGRVRDFLMSQGVPGSKMAAVGYGSTRPAVPNDSDANRALNRRVQIELSPNEKLKAQEGSSGNN
ncbi:OmpA family protein [Geomonas anaerohicana]|uniref:OmpA family protein n=1 Tax=Geomonas anaerohicana TaxID=2798583 RepID=A0ABS0YIC8_9BACT|nr:OmpA family protein [Geomonas anaerohicana]MBJ6751669.1 OmpA family protein [Geomonas anaerohicana]